MGPEKKAEELREHVEAEIVDMGDDDYLNCLEELISLLQTSIEAKKEEQESGR